MQLQNNTVGAYSAESGRNDVLLWYPEISGKYSHGNASLPDGTITLADERAQWTAWKSKLATNGVKIGP